MESVTFEHVEKKNASFGTQRADGSLILVEAGKPYTAKDEDEVRILDMFPHAVKRVKAED